MSKVELRLTEVDPPAPDPTRTLYTDILNLPDPVRLGLTCRIFNFDDVDLYMRVDGYASGWTFTSNDLGLLGTGANMYRNLDNFGTRAKPTAEKTETIAVRLRAYTDSGYTNLKWTFERTITIVFINSADPSYTQDVLNNFDDGTVQGWAITRLSYKITQSILGLAVSTDYALSEPYSLRGMAFYSTTDTGQHVYIKYIEVRTNGTILVHIGRPQDLVAGTYVPLDKWLRIVVPLPKNATIEIRIVWDIIYYPVVRNFGDLPYLYKSFTTPNKSKVYAIIDLRPRIVESGATAEYWTYIYLDDFKIISK